MGIVLYRGDSTKIKNFEYSKTNKRCLLGQGVYLTDSLKIAASYRKKGVRSLYTKDPSILFDGEAKDRTEAFELAFPGFGKLMWEKEKDISDWWTRLNEKDKAKYLESKRELYNILIESKQIVAKYSTRSPAEEVIKIGKSASSVKSRIKSLKETHKNVIKVKLMEDIDIGFLTSFEFDEKDFNSSVFNVDIPCNDVWFWELMYSSKIMIGKKANNIDKYVSENIGSSVYKAVRTETKDVKEPWNKIKKVLQPKGYIGYEYKGGVRIGFNVKHRAFCIWNDEYVNAHKVKRFK